MEPKSPKKQDSKIDVLMAWNAEQERASQAIAKKLKSIPGLQPGSVKKTVLKGLQPHIERRLFDSTEPEGGSVG